MARQPKTTAQAEPLTPDSPAPEVKTPEAPNTVLVHAKYPPFVDLINDIRIGADPTTVVMHPWLQANIDSGLLIQD